MCCCEVSKSRANNMNKQHYCSPISYQKVKQGDSDLARSSMWAGEAEGAAGNEGEATAAVSSPLLAPERSSLYKRRGRSVSVAGPSLLDTPGPKLRRLKTQ